MTAIRLGEPVFLDDYAVNRGVVAIQEVLVDAGAYLALDGVFYTKTEQAVIAWQAANDLKSDGVVGPISTRTMFGRYLGAFPDYNLSTRRLSFGHMVIESQCDPGAVGQITPDDVGLGQISGKNSKLALAQRFNPDRALTYVLDLVEDNLAAFDDMELYAVAAYMLGQAGCRSWLKAGKPDVWERLINDKPTRVPVRRYVDSVLAAAVLY